MLETSFQETARSRISFWLTKIATSLHREVDSLEGDYESYAKHAADGSFEGSYGKHAAPENGVHNSTGYTYQNEYAGQNGSPEAQGVHAYTTGFNGDKPPKHKNPKYVTKRFFIITLIISMMITSNSQFMACGVLLK